VSCVSVLVILFVSQSALQMSVNKAAQLLLFNASKFMIPLAAHEEASCHSYHKARLSTQFSAHAPKVINYDPARPVREHSDSTAVFTQSSRLSMSSMRFKSITMSSAAPQPLDVRSLLYNAVLCVPQNMCPLFLCIRSSAIDILYGVIFQSGQDF